MYPAGDAELVQIMDAALADATLRAGSWLTCRPGCNQCCTGVFRISPLDAERLRHGLDQLAVTDEYAALLVRERVATSRARLSGTYPGDVTSGLLSDEDDAQEAFDDFANDEICPVLDPKSGTCSLYAYRPFVCRTFGPPVQTQEGGLAVCELCFTGATSEEIGFAQMTLPPPELEKNLATSAGMAGDTIVTFALGLA